jgi:hypothetical protein
MLIIIKEIFVVTDFGKNVSTDHFGPPILNEFNFDSRKSEFVFFSICPTEENV